ncbi:hypothetical protein PSTT_01514 [Puccinia striiformis]|uniref:Uncharacterized protein n=1 Tax=Puccinia striiformis TaxID=27350 RepID=A0A2S4W3D0_9BASI|nr:hypothetical protein PSTT_01514 [Puccinia striiformis]
MGTLPDGVETKPDQLDKLLPTRFLLFWLGQVPPIGTKKGS